jgi:hypothetical protein
MPIPNISRNVNTIQISAAATIGFDVDQVICNATSAGFTVTIYDDLNSGTYHRLVIAISPDDSSGNTVTIVNQGGTFSTTLASTSAAVELETQYDGTWIITAAFPTLDANTAISAADSAGLEASNAFSEATSAGLAASAAESGVTLNAATILTNKSIAASATLSGTSASQSIAASATLSGTSASRSIAASATLSGVSNAISSATSQNTAQSTVISENLSTALSAAESA